MSRMVQDQMTEWSAAIDCGMSLSGPPDIRDFFPPPRTGAQGNAVNNTVMERGAAKMEGAPKWA